MASDNRILGMTYPEASVPEIGHGFPPNLRAPAWRYHAELCPRGKIIKLDSELDRLDAEGWVDHIGKTARLPGLEYVYDKYMKDKGIEVPGSTIGIPDPTPVLTPAQISAVTQADKLKAESDRIEKLRLEKEAKREKESKGPEILSCPFPGCDYTTEKKNALRMHMMSKHKGQTPPEPKQESTPEPTQEPKQEHSTDTNPPVNPSEAVEAKG